MGNSTTPWTTQGIVSWLLGGSRNPLTYVGQPFFELGQHASMQDWISSCDHARLIGKAVIETIDATGHSINACNGKVTLTYTNPLKNRHQLDKLRVHPQRCDLISEIAYVLASSIATCTQKHVRIKCEIEDCAQSLSNAISVEFEQASFLVVKPDNIEEVESNSVFSFKDDDVSVFGWVAASPAAPTLKFDKNSRNSLCHFPAFFSHENGHCIKVINNDNAEIVAVETSDKDYAFLIRKGITPYLESYCKLEDGIPRLIIWLGVAPTAVGFKPSIAKGSPLMATFWAIAIHGAVEPSELEEIEKSVITQVDKIRYRMLLAFSNEVMSELSRQQDEKGRMADDYNSIKDQLKVLVDSLVSVQTHARAIKAKISPDSWALFAQQFMISELFDEKKKGCLIPGCSDARHTHIVEDWQSLKEVQEVFAKIASLLCGDEKCWNDGDPSEIKANNALNNLSRGLDDGRYARKVLAEMRLRLLTDTPQDANAIVRQLQNALEMDSYEQIIELHRIIKICKRRFYTVYKITCDKISSNDLFGMFRCITDLPLFTINLKDTVRNANNVLEHQDSWWPVRGGYAVEFFASLICDWWVSQKNPSNAVIVATIENTNLRLEFTPALFHEVEKVYRDIEEYISTRATYDIEVGNTAWPFLHLYNTATGNPPAFAPNCSGTEDGFKITWFKKEKDNKEKTCFTVKFTNHSIILGPVNTHTE